MNNSGYNIVLINCGVDSIFKESIKEKYNFPPYGLLTIASVLKTHGYNVKLIDLLNEYLTIAEFRKTIIESHANTPLLAFGLPSYTESIHLTYELAGIIKRTFPNIPIIVGGVHATFCAEECILNDNIDYIVLDEGESTIIHLLEYIKYPSINIEGIKGIVYKNIDGEICRNIKRPLIKVTDNLPFPAYELIANNKCYSDILSVITSRGCPGDCVFCSSKAFSGDKYRMHSAEWILSLLYYYNKSIKQYRAISFMDDTFTVSKRRLKILKQFVKVNNWKHNWVCKSRVDNLDEETVSLLAGCGCKSIHIGIESGDQEILKSIDKNITLDQCIDAIKLLNKYGIRVECSFIIGHANDTLESIEKTMFFATEIEKNKLGMSHIGISTPYPGTKLFVRSNEMGISIITYNWKNYNTRKPIYETEQYSINDIKEAMFLFELDRNKINKNGVFHNIEISEYKTDITRKLKNIKKVQLI